jgi:hypothetical protein
MHDQDATVRELMHSWLAQDYRLATRPAWTTTMPIGAIGIPDSSISSITSGGL